MATVTFEDATRTYPGTPTPAVDSLNMEIGDGECVVFVGPSGCGKSTSLRMVAGLEPTTSGRVLINGQDMTGVRPKARDVAMVFQSYALYPNMTVRANMAFALENAKVPKDQIRERVDQVAQLLELTPYLDRRPAALSGGQRQRVAMGRAIVRKPQVFCMDEPLSNLDAKLRVSMRGEIVSLQRNLGVTTIYVTHDQVEAMTMGHRVAVMNGGKLQQVAAPEVIYRQPANTFVAGFIGSPAISLFECPVQDGLARLGSLTIPLPTNLRATTGSTIIIGIRPESWQLAPTQEAGLGARCEILEPLGSQSYLYVGVEPNQAGERVFESDSQSNDRAVSAARLAVLLPRGMHPTIGDSVALVPITSELLFFDPVTHENLAI